MPPASFPSHAPRGEDVVLARAFARVPQPRFLEIVGAADAPSRCAALLEHRWEGQTLTGSTIVRGAGAGSAQAPVHALLIDAAGSEQEVLAALDLGALSPWVVLIRSDSGLAGEPAPEGALRTLLDAGYRPGLFDGASHYLVAPDHASTLLALVDHPAGPDDDFTTPEQRAVEARLASLEGERATLEEAHDALVRELVACRVRAVEGWSDATSARHLLSAAGGNLDYESLLAELDAVHHTLSWRVTRPLRAMRRIARPRRGVRA